MKKIFTTALIEDIHPSGDLMTVTRVKGKNKIYWCLKRTVYVLGILIH